MADAGQILGALDSLDRRGVRDPESLRKYEELVARLANREGSPSSDEARWLRETMKVVGKTRDDLVSDIEAYLRRTSERQELFALCVVRRQVTLF